MDTHQSTENLEVVTLSNIGDLSPQGAGIFILIISVSFGIGYLIPNLIWGPVERPTGPLNPEEQTLFNGAANADIIAEAQATNLANAAEFDAAYSSELAARVAALPDIEEYMNDIGLESLEASAEQSANVPLDNVPPELYPHLISTNSFSELAVTVGVLCIMSIGQVLVGAYFEK